MDTAKSTIIVLHPGSQTIKFGLSSDNYPQSIPNVVARKVNPAFRAKNGHSYQSNGHSASPIEHRTTEKLKLLEQIEQKLTNWRLRRNEEESGMMVDPLANQDQTIFDCDNCLQILPQNEDSYFQENATKLLHIERDQPSFLVGDEAKLVFGDPRYDVLYPIRYGRLNLEKESLQVICNNLEVIWSFIFHNKLRIPKADLSKYSIVLLIPDTFEPVDVGEMVSLLFNTFHFSSVLLQQESGAAAIGCGLPSCCVVDIGHHKTSVCCVDDGVVIPNTRFTMNYGGYHISQSLEWILKNKPKYFFPFTECDISNPIHEDIINQMKESLANFYKTEEVYPDTFQYVLRPRSSERLTLGSGQPTKMYHMNIANEPLLAVMGVFFPKLFDNIPSYKPRKQHTTHDPFEDILSEVSRTKTEGKQAGNDLNHGSDRRIDHRPVIGVDKAVIASIRCMERAEVKKRMFSTILVTGGCALVPAFKEILEYRITRQLPQNTDAEKVETVTLKHERDIDPRFMSWRGGAILASLPPETIDTLWVKSTEYGVSGMRAFWEKSLFVWQPNSS